MDDQLPLISVLLPTRGRTDTLRRSVQSLLNHALKPEQVEFLLAFDNDDTESVEWFQNNIADQIDQAESVYTCYSYEPLGYIRLNAYVNSLAERATGRWLLFWNDDAVMQTVGWDQEIAQHNEFAVLRMPAHNEHPYAIFPVVPQEWVDVCGYVSAHQLTDAWVSQIAYLLDIMINIPVKVLHDRYDLTGNNEDSTYQKRSVLEGNIDAPGDFNHVDQRRARFNDAKKIANFLRENGQDTSWFDRVLEGKQNPWVKMIDPKYDPNQQLSRLQ